jgi:hypothetical protein
MNWPHAPIHRFTEASVYFVTAGTLYVTNAEEYPWCSASWFARTARPSFVSTVRNMKIDRVKVFDEFEVVSGS